MNRQIFVYSTRLIRLGFIGIAGHQAWSNDWTGVFVTFQALVISLLPYFLYRWREIYTPFALRAGIVFFMFATLILGEIADFYNTFWWWDVILHTVASVGITLIVFITLLIFYKQSELRSTAFFTTSLAVGTSLSASVLWEIYEFLIDIFFVTDTPMQLDNTDTMTDLIVAIAGAVLVGVFGYRYIKWRDEGILGEVIKEGAAGNK